MNKGNSMLKYATREVVCFLSLLIALQSYAQNKSNLITNVQGRTTIRLDGNWHYIIDPYETGFYNYRWQPYDDTFNPGSGAYYTNAKMQHDADRVEYDFAKSATLRVPGGWNFQAPELKYYEGSIWYQRDFTYSKKEGKRVYIYFGAVNYESHVYVNGKKVGEHIGGFDPFNFEVTDQLVEGDNFIVVRVKNDRRRDGVPTLNTDWWNHGGITRSVRLIEVPNTFVQSYKVQLKKGTIDVVDGYIQLTNSKVGDKVSVLISELGVNHICKVDKEGRAYFSFKTKKLTLWEPENPKLYQITIKSDKDKITERIGFRSIEVEGGDILLNGKKIFLRGICAHEENPVSGTRITTETEARMIYQRAKELNTNFIRLAHYPHNEYMPRLADELGFLLWEEIPVYWTIQWKSKSTLANAKNQLQELIRRDQNRASVIIWSVANETPVVEERLSFLKSLIETARTLDNTRLVSAAMEVHYSSEGHTINDPLGAYTDVISFNQYIGWYGGKAEDFPNAKWTSVYEKPILVSEWGAGALYGYRGDEHTIWTEDFQARLYRKTLEGIDNIPNLTGFTPWILSDFRSPKRNLPVIQDGWNRKGIIGEGGHKKLAFYILRDYYQQKISEGK